MELDGHQVGYKFFPGENCIPFVTKEAWWRKRAGFVDYHVWVTPNDPKEMFAAGDYPNQSQGGDGLDKWVEQVRWHLARFVRSHTLSWSFSETGWRACCGFAAPPTR